MAKKIFIGSFTLQTKEETLRELFSRYGKVISFSLIMDQITGSSRGFGFVEMDTDENATEAITKLNGHLLDGRNIVVKEALAKTSYKGMHDVRGFGNRRPRRY